MKKSVLRLTIMLLALAFTNFAVAAPAKTKVIIEDKSIIGDLKVKEKIVITSEMVTSGKEQKFEIATFCTYTNNKDGKVEINISNAEKGFQIVGTKGEGKINYTLSVSNQVMKYGKNQLKVDVNDSPVSCKTLETVYMTLSGNAIKNAKAGTYNASLELAIK